MGNGNRRQFLLGAGATLAGVAHVPRMFAGVRSLHPDRMELEGSPAPEAQKSPLAVKMRGLMLDAGRVPESIEYYRRVIEFCAEWELNALQFRLADDQGTALRFTSAPDLVTHGNALTADELRSLAEYAQSHGVDLIPELESFGHTGFITRSPAYAHLLDTEADGDREFSGVIPVSPATLELFSKLYREVAAIFPSIYLHGGCDEVNWGGSELSRKALQTKSRARIWAEYLNALGKLAEGLGKQFIVWGDFVLHKEPEILGQLSKKIIIMDWSYYDNSSASIHETYLRVRANGSRGIGAPALSCYKWGARVGVEQLRNIDAFAESYFDANDSGSLGVILTNWIPSRYVQNSIWDGFAYAAVAFKEGSATAQTSGFRRFVEKHYRAEWNEMWSEAFQIIYEAAPAMHEEDHAGSAGLPLHVPWSSDQQLAALLHQKAPGPNPFTRLRGLLVQLEPQVIRNLADFQAFELSAEYLERAYWREAAVVELAAAKPERDTSALLIQSIAERDKSLADALTADWDRGRPRDAAAKSELVFGLQPKDELLFQWKRAAAYSASLADHPDRFHQLIAATK